MKHSPIRLKKRFRLFAIGLLASAATLALSQTASAESLTEALAAAYESNPSLQAQRAILRSIDENVMQSNAGYLPGVEGTGSIERADTVTRVEGVTTSEGNFPGSRIAFVPVNKSLQARLTQPIFRGFRTANSVKEAKAQVEVGRANLKSVEQDVLLQTVTAYVNVVRDIEVLKLNDNQIAVLRRQLEASEDRFRVGEITRTDVAQSQARLSDAISRRAAAAADLTASREAYRRVVGDLPGTLTRPPLPVLPLSVEDAIQTALDASPGVEAARNSEIAAKHAVSAAKGALLPTLDGFASISRNQRETVLGVDVTADITSTVKTIGAQVSVPLYQSGAEYSAVRQAKQVRSQRMLEIRAAERLAIEAVSTAWEIYQATVAQIKSNNESVRANTIALDGVRQEAAVGSRTTLDVLDAEQETLDSQVNLVRAQRDQVVAAYSLLNATGRLTALQLDLPVDIYNPEEHYDDVKWKLVGFGD